MKKLALVSVAALLTGLSLAGCSPAAAPRPTATSKPTIKVGEDAAAIAARIPGCSQVKAGDVAAGGPAMASTATCTLGGHIVNIDSWSSIPEADITPVILSTHAQAYFATGSAWTVTLGDDPALQYQLTNQAGKLLQSSFTGATPAPTNLVAEQEMAARVVQALGGHVVHVSTG